MKELIISTKPMSITNKDESASAGAGTSTGATGNSATAGATASTGSNSTAGAAATSSTSSWKTKFQKIKIWFKKFDRITTKAAHMLGKVFWAMLIAYVAGYFVPELRGKLPYFYEFVDSGLDCFNYIWKLIVEFIKWYVHFITFGNVSL